MKIKHVYWFAYFHTGEPSVRYRATYALEELKRHHQISYSIVYPGYDLASIGRFVWVWCAALLFRRRDSLIVFQKIYKGGLYTSALKLLLFFRSAHTLYDIDDAEHTRHPVDTLHYFMRRCSACSVGSAALIDYVRPMNPNICLLTSPVMEHPHQKTQPEARFSIGWIGYYGAHRESLMRLLFPAVLAVDFPVRLALLGVVHQAQADEIRAYFAANPLVELDMPQIPDWLDETAIYQRLQRLDVGVAPLLDTEFNRAKSAFKLKQCMSCGVPVLASRVGENARFLREGYNGYFCDSPAEYLQALRAVYQMRPADRLRLSANARATQSDFDMEHYCTNFLLFWEKPPANAPVVNNL